VWSLTAQRGGLVACIAFIALMTSPYRIPAPKSNGRVLCCPFLCTPPTFVGVKSEMDESSPSQNPLMGESKERKSVSETATLSKGMKPRMVLTIPSVEGDAILVPIGC
jgi:hypothetical protein